VVAAGGVLALSSLASADAPTDQYGLFDLADFVIHDQQTGLYWQRYASTSPTTFAGAATACAALSLPSYPAPWRVPSYKELLTLVDEAPHVEYEGVVVVSKSIDGNAFPGALVDQLYWSSSPYLGAGSSGYAVNFGTGEADSQYMASSGYVRCVR
jgi:hypothetical protein